MLCLKINYIREKKCKEQFIENIVFLLFYLSVLSWDCNYSHSLLILLFYFILKKKHIPTDGLKLTLNIVFLVFIQTNVSNFMLIAINI